MIYPSLVLTSAVVNRQALHLTIWVGALAVNAFANGVAIALGGRALAIAWNDVWIQALTVLVVFEVAMPYIGGPSMRRVIYGPVLVASAVAAGAGLLLHWTETPEASRLGLVVQLFGRAGAVMVVWAALGLLLWIRGQFRRRITVSSPA
jgi:hypothetical protein